MPDRRCVGIVQMVAPTWVKPLHNGNMADQVTLDQGGRVVLPKAIREQLHLSAGDTLVLTVKGEEVTLRPRRSTTPLEKERGVWVFRTGKPFTEGETQDALRSIRNDRDRRNLSESA
jgi:AbrB family looped-hinge helix DNA binding protein